MLQKHCILHPRSICSKGLRPVGTKLILGGCERSEPKWGVRGLAPGKIFISFYFIIAAHHMEVADRSKLLVNMRLWDISSIYDDSELRNRLDNLSRNKSIERYTSSFPKASRGCGRKRPR